MSKEPLRLTSKQATEFKSALLGYDFPSFRARLFGAGIASAGVLGILASSPATVLAAPKYCAVVLELVNTGSPSTREITAADNATSRVIAKEDLHAEQRLIVDAPSTDGVTYSQLKVSLKGSNFIIFNGPCVDRGDPRWVLGLAVTPDERLTYLRPGESIPNPSTARTALATATVTAQDLQTAYRGVNNLFDQNSDLRTQNSSLRELVQIQKKALFAGLILGFASLALTVRNRFRRNRV